MSREKFVENVEEEILELKEQLLEFEKKARHSNAIPFTELKSKIDKINNQIDQLETKINNPGANRFGRNDLPNFEEIGIMWYKVNDLMQRI